MAGILARYLHSPVEYFMSIPLRRLLRWFKTAHIIAEEERAHS